MSIVIGIADSSDDYSIMRCNSSSGLWDTLQECSLSSNQPEVITELPDINQTMFIPDYEVVDEIDNWDKVQVNLNGWQTAASGWQQTQKFWPILTTNQLLLCIFSFW